MDNLETMINLATQLPDKASQIEPYILYHLNQYDSYLQLVAKLHITYFAFHFTANATALGFYSQHHVPFIRHLFLYTNLLAGFLSLSIYRFYVVAKKKMGDFIIDNMQFIQVDMKSPLPTWLWTGVALSLAIVLFAMALGWCLVSELECKTNDQKSSA